MPSHFILLFPFADPQWTTGLHLLDPRDHMSETNRKVTMRMWAIFRLMTRSSDGTLVDPANPQSNRYASIHLAGRLFQEFVCDVWCTIEQNDLNFLRQRQNQYRAELQSGIMDAIANDTPLDEIGQAVVLPSSHTGSVRNMRDHFFNSMVLVREFGSPSFFITMTCNPRWPDIINNIPRGQNATDRPDIVARVFKKKLDALIAELTNNAMGTYRGRCWVVEYQKRGLPHAHILLWVTGVDLTNPAIVDQFISAEIPHDDEVLANIVLKHQMHNCTPKCRPDEFSKCSKHFPKPYSTETAVNPDSYALPRRRNAAAGGDDRNSLVVPYNPYLSRLFDCHLNVEVCFGIKAVKYIHKYLHKGQDRCWVDVNAQNDEIQAHLDSRYVSSMEAAYRIFMFPTHNLMPSVMTLQVHLEGQQWIVYNPNANQTVIHDTPLIAYFKFNSSLAESDPTFTLPRYTYEQFPEHYSWNSKTHEWRPRNNNRRQFGRLVFIYPGSGERYFLRMLLNIVPGAQSFAHLRTVTGHNGNLPFPTFREACAALGLLDEDRAWVNLFTDAATFQTGSQLRQLFVSVLPEITDPQGILQQFAEFFQEGLLIDLQTNFTYLESIGDVNNITTVDATVDPIANILNDFMMFKFSEQLEKTGKSLATFGFDMPNINWPEFTREGVHVGVSSDFYDFELDETNDIIEDNLNPEQQEAFDTVVNMVLNFGPGSDQQPNLFFLNGPGGTGKTFLYKKIYHFLRGRGKIVMCVASSGCAALLLPRGSTAHHRFKIPVNVDSDSVCSVSKSSVLAECLLNTDLFIWDEATLQNRYVFETVDRTLRDLTSNADVPFGGKAFLFGGDWSQCLPVIRGKTNSADIVPFTLKRSYLWSHITVLKLVTNMRLNANTSPNNAAYAAWLANISRNPAYFNVPLNLPEYLARVHTVNDLIENIFPAQDLLNPDPDSAIITTTNRAVNEINDIIFDKLDLPAMVYRAHDSIFEDNVQFHHYSQENLNSMHMEGLPSGIISLKVNCIVMLLRNVNSDAGLCNGTRLKVLELQPYSIKASIIGGAHDGEITVIYRMTLQSQDGGFVFKRKQFPVRLAYAMTVHKSQGQSLNKVGIDLTSDVFAHGLLYVALSRATNTENVYLLTPDDDSFQVMNKVFSEVVDDIVD
ncbi:unnamed protein product [Ambrosiozyma monospora]|uniref:ATP-dependent DNA helicase n=1 Tax=Ambrosiozyma monospora TaxID=43982 RepID=A0A9W6YVU0_AMBMO|nr:unnamed protein product [Ambrosiozyma monospora]